MHTDWKEKNITALFANDMLVYIENPKKSAKIYDKWVHQSHGIQNKISIIFLYTINEHVEIDIKKYNTTNNCSKNGNI